MSPALKGAFEAELVAARANAEDPDKVMHHLSRAHILSQRHTGAHARVHWLMLKAGFAEGDVREVFGQVTRMIAAGLFSRVWVPIGNTGRANVSALRPMPIPDDLRQLLREAD